VKRSQALHIGIVAIVVSMATSEAGLPNSNYAKRRPDRQQLTIVREDYSGNFVGRFGVADLA
jgi:hypothetical protein